MSSEHIEARRREREERRRIRDQEHQERRESAQRDRDQRRVEHSRLRGGRDNVVACRLDDADLAALDAVVEAGVRSTRSDAAAWLIKAGLEVNKPLLDDVSGTVTEIRRLREEALRKARRFAGIAIPDPGRGDEAAASSRPASDAHIRATDQHAVQGGDD